MEDHRLAHEVQDQSESEKSFYDSEEYNISDDPYFDQVQVMIKGDDFIVYKDPDNGNTRFEYTSAYAKRLLASLKVVQGLKDTCSICLNNPQKAKCIEL